MGLNSETQKPKKTKRNQKKDDILANILNAKNNTYLNGLMYVYT